jgi:hypothetical protein
MAAAQQSVQLTCGSLRGLGAFFWLWVFPTSQTESTPTHTQLTQTVRQPVENQKQFLNRRLDLQVVFENIPEIRLLFYSFVSLQHSHTPQRTRRVLLSW